MADTPKEDNSEKTELPPMGWLDGNAFTMPPTQVFLSARSIAMTSGGAFFVPMPPPPPNYKEPAADHPIYNLIGRNAAKMGRFEHEQDRIIWKLAGVSDEIGACLTSATLGYGNRFHVIVGLMKTLGIKNGIVERMAKLGRVVSDAAEERNRYIHDAWLEEASSKTLHQYKAVSRTEIRKDAGEKMDVGLSPTSMDKLETTINDIEGHTKRLLTLRDEILAELNTSPGKSLESPS
jgi:hypothetical protein